MSFFFLLNHTQLTAMDVQTPPRKKQRLSQELSSSLVNSPVEQPLQHESSNDVVDQHEHEQQQLDQDNDVVIDNEDTQKENKIPYKESVSAKTTPLKPGALAKRSNNNTPNHSVIAADSTLSPVKSSKLNTATSINTTTEDSLEKNGADSEPSFKQLINRYHSIVETTDASDDDEEANEDLEESSSELIGFTNQLVALKNQYQSKINSLERTIQENATTINGLNNQINDYKTKIENLHLSIQQSHADQSSVATENEIAKQEIEILQKSITKLDSQLVVEKSKRSKLSAKLTQLTELLDTIFQSYENMHEKIFALKEENANLQDVISKKDTKIASFNDTLKSELESLAQELYIQYAEKHETKISKLRTAYDNKYAKKQALFNDRLKVMHEQQQTLQQELSHVKTRLQVESNEKHQLVKLWDEYVALDKKDVDQMSNFVKRLK